MLRTIHCSLYDELVVGVQRGNIWECYGVDHVGTTVQCMNNSETYSDQYIRSALY